MSHTDDVLVNVRAALGRSKRPVAVPTPPAIEQPVARLVHTDFGLPELYTRMARKAQLHAEAVMVDELADKLCQYLRQRGCHHIFMPNSPFLEKLGLPAAISAAGFALDRGAETISDQMDCAITGVYAVVAETGSLVIRPHIGQGGTLPLQVPIHVAIVQPKDCLPDLLDLMERLTGEDAGDTILISGASKTTGLVQVFVLS